MVHQSLPLWFSEVGISRPDVNGDVGSLAIAMDTEIQEMLGEQFPEVPRFHW